MSDDRVGQATVADLAAQLRANIEQVGKPVPTCACGDHRCDGRWVIVEDGPYQPCSLWQRNAERAGRRETHAALGTDLGRYARSWPDIHVEHESWEFVREVCFAPGDLLVEPGLSLVFSGPRGRGKSQAGVMVARATQTAGLLGRYVVWPTWWSSVKATFGPGGPAGREQDLVRELLRPDVLVLDEVGSGLDERSRYAWALFESVIGARYDAKRKSTIVSTNLTPLRLAIASSGYVGDRALEVEDRIRAATPGDLTVDDLPSRSFSRLKDSAKWVTFDGPNYRAREDAAQRDQAVNAIEARMRARRERSS